MLVEASLAPAIKLTVRLYISRNRRKVSAATYWRQARQTRAVCSKIVLFLYLFRTVTTVPEYRITAARPRNGNHAAAGPEKPRKFRIMLTAKQKRRENIAEYILYLWQLEDMLRALELSPEKIYSTLVEPHTELDQEQKQALFFWYMDMVNLLKTEGKEKTGHLDHTLHLIADLNDLHLHLLKAPAGHEQGYDKVYAALAPELPKLKSAIAGESDMAAEGISDMEACKMADAQDLVIAVDHHNPDQCGAPDILRQQKRKIVIDHHRRSENFIDDPLLVYVETGASSVSELITELLPYQTNKVHLSEEEATIMRYPFSFKYSISSFKCGNITLFQS